MENKAIIIHYKLCPSKTLAFEIGNARDFKSSTLVKILESHLLAQPIQYSMPILLLKISHGLRLFNFGLRTSENDSLIYFEGFYCFMGLRVWNKITEKAVAGHRLVAMLI